MRHSARIILAMPATALLIGAMTSCWSGDSDGGEGPKVSPVISRMPVSTDYDTVPLPSTAPPSGALVVVRSMADPAQDGEHVAFEYDGFTIQACTVSDESANKDACVPQIGVQTIRSYKEGGATTTYTVSSKDALPTEAEDAVAFFATAPLTRMPEWVPGYAETTLKEYYG